jgi:hypothetical protein
MNGSSGVNCEDCDIAPTADENSLRYHHARPWIGDVGNARRLWGMTEQMIADA